MRLIGAGPKRPTAADVMRPGPTARHAIDPARSPRRVVGRVPRWPGLARRRHAVAIPLLFATSVALAHAPGDAWLESWVLGAAQLLFGCTWIAYGLGAGRRRPTPARRLMFHTMMSIAALTLFGPFDSWAADSTALHMVQHMLLIVVVAPMAVFARPLPQWRASLGARLDPLWRAAMRITRDPLTCAGAHAAAVWIWHAPVPYMVAVTHLGWHLVEHACFVGSAGLFWWSVLRSGRHAAGRAMVALLITLMHTGLLGALLTFAREPLYWRESRDLQDQQLAGLVMWVPGSAAYLLAAAYVAWRWLDASPVARRAPHLPHTPD